MKPRKTMLARLIAVLSAALLGGTANQLSAAAAAAPTPKDCTDAGWPIKDGLHLTTTKGMKPRIEGPIHPFRAEAAPKLRITGTWKGLKGTGHVTWKVLGNDQPAKPLSASFPIPETGREATVEVDLAARPEFKGLITQLTVWLADTPVDGGEVVIRSIATVPAKR